MKLTSKRLGKSLQMTKLCCFTAGLAVVLTGPLAASESLREPLATIAKATATILQGRGLDSIGIGEFSGPPAFGSASGPGIRVVLIEELAKLNIREKKVGAQVGIQGRYFLKPQDDPNFQAPAQLRLEASLVDRQGQVLTDLNTDIKLTAPNGDDLGSVPVSQGKVTVDAFGGLSDMRGTGILSEALGATVDLQPASEEAPLDGDSVINSFDRPTAYVHNGTAVAASQTSPFTVEILVGDAPRQIALEDGQPFVELKKAESFQLRFTNRAPYDVAVTFLLDGVSSFQFSDVRHERGPKRGQPRYSRWIIPRGESVTVKGWHRTNEYVDAFLVTDFGNSAAAKFGSTTGLGTITTSVRATWRNEQERPSDEPKSYAVAVDVGIGQGEQLEQQVEENRDPREYGVPRAVITVRYTKPSA